MKVAAKSDVVESMKQQLIALVDWAQYIPAFNNFAIEDRVSYCIATLTLNLPCLSCVIHLL